MNLDNKAFFKGKSMISNRWNKMKTFTYCVIVLLILEVNSKEDCVYENEEETELNNFKSFGRGEIVENEYIVTFQRYMLKEEHSSLLLNIFGTSDGWSIIPRNNPSWGLPSDFSLVKIMGDKINGNSALDSLRKSSEVRHVVPQKRFTGSLKSLESVEDFIPSNQTGRAHTRFSEEEVEYTSPGMRKLHAAFQVPELFNAHFLWEKQYTGTGVKVAVFDTGLRRSHPHFKNVIEIKNWTDENTSDDGLGHGTFVAGVIASQSECLGFAPDVDIYVFRVFTNNRVSYTSWFLDAFNYAILSKVNILNLSIGGPDFMDQPFVEKVWELSANNIIVVSAIGNDGPLYGTLNNPADQLDVIGVGGIDFSEKLASFSSRGMTTWELPEGYGRIKPDILAYGQSVQGSRINGGCRALSGTSVASPVIAGAVALLASTLPETTRWDTINPASIKQVLIGGAERLKDANIFEQGSGKLNLLDSYELLRTYQPHVSCLPSSLDLTSCPYMWPYCSQPLYYSAMPVIINVTLLNGMGVSGEIESVPVFKPGNNGHWLELSFSYPEFLWPWTGYLGIKVRVNPEATEEGDAEGLIVFTVVSPPALGETEPRRTRVELPLKVHVIPTPSRDKRILWDQYHNLRYPSGYFPRDALDVKDEPFDWNGDHVHTNFKGMYNFLRNQGYFIEVLGSPYTCFDANNYGTLLIVDSEEEFFPQEIKKFTDDVRLRGMSVIVIADWYNVEVMKKINFYDENTRQWWSPVTGGTNIPAVNDLLKDFGIAFGDKIYFGEYELKKTSSAISRRVLFGSGPSIARFPKGGRLGYFTLSDQTNEILTGKNDKPKENVPVLGLYSTTSSFSSSTYISQLNTSGRIVVFGDSSCLDDSYNGVSCFWLLENLLEFSMYGKVNSNLELEKDESEEYKSATSVNLPVRLEGTDFHKYSKVVGRSATCKIDHFNKFNESDVDQSMKISWEYSKKEPYSSNGKFIEQSFAREIDDSRSIRKNVGGLFWPSIIGIILFGAICVFVLKARKERNFSKRFLV